MGQPKAVLSFVEKQILLKLWRLGLLGVQTPWDSGIFRGQNIFFEIFISDFKFASAYSLPS